MSTAEESPVLFLGHPFSSIGKGQELRSNLQALLSLDERAQCLDIYGHATRTDAAHRALILPIETRRTDARLRIFHINGDEVQPALAHLDLDDAAMASARNVIVPAWELPRYPAEWAEALRRFDEVWAISSFVAEGLQAAGVPSHHIGQSAQLAPGPLLSRRSFGIRESAFVFLAFADASSYLTRKNPEAAVALFRNLRASRPFDDIQLVLKVKRSEEALGPLPFAVDLARDDVVLIDGLLDEQQQYSLIAQADCLVSLHRAEGFGRGLAEAMGLGCLALGTGWSGNMDFMSEENSLPVGYSLVPVNSGEYPHGAGQQWAEPDADHALWLAQRALDDQPSMTRLREQARTDILLKAGNRAVGLRMLNRMRELLLPVTDR